jgi:C4-dicarboxylate transporter DctM subunit
MFVLMALGLPIAFSFAVVGFVGTALITGFEPALYLVGSAPFTWTSMQSLLPLPLFVLMGQFAFYSGISSDLFTVANKWLGRFPGGLAQATTLACTGFAACTGDSLAAAATMGTIAYPMMEKYNYSRRLSTSCIATGGTLGVLIPPSMAFIIYGMLTQTSIADLFIAGILPGLLLSGLLLIMIYTICKLNPSLGPRGDVYSWRERFAALPSVWGMLLLFIIVIGGLYLGVFAPSEAGGIGAFGAFIIGLGKRRINRSAFVDALKGSLQITCFVLTILIGAMIFNVLLSTSGLAGLLSDWIASLTVSPYIILVIVLFMYLILGMFMDPVAMTVITVPTIVPILTNLGFDPVWLGVLFVVMGEIGLITPPVGVNVYVVQGVTKVPLEEIFRGVYPFVIAMLVCVVILVIFPQIVLFIPYLNK